MLNVARCSGLLDLGLSYLDLNSTKVALAYSILLAAIALADGLIPRLSVFGRKLYAVLLVIGVDLVLGSILDLTSSLGVPPSTVISKWLVRLAIVLTAYVFATWYSATTQAELQQRPPEIADASTDQRRRRIRGSIRRYQP